MIYEKGAVHTGRPDRAACRRGAGCACLTMDDVERLIEAFGALGKRDHSARKLDLLMDLGRLDDPRLVSFLDEVAVDGAPPADVPDRRAAQAAGGDGSHPARHGPGRAAGADDRPDGALRLHAALVLGDFVDVPGVVEGLGALATSPDEPIELRYNAFTSLQRAGPTQACVALMRALCADEILGAERAQRPGGLGRALTQASRLGRPGQEGRGAQTILVTWSLRHALRGRPGRRLALSDRR